MSGGKSNFWVRPAPTFSGGVPAAILPAALPDLRELAVIALERTRMAMVVTDPRQKDNPIVMANNAFLSLTGYSADEVIGQNCRFLQGPRTKPEVIEAISRGLRAGNGEIDVEMVNYRKDGSAYWMQLMISPVYDDEGVLIYYFGSQKDITTRRRAQELEAAERLLLMEVDHRAMNALALVQSIMRLSRSDDVESFTEKVSGRVDALSRAHRVLSESGWTQARFVDLVSMETRFAPGANVDLDGPDEYVPAQLVQPLTLVLHELMTNALKHGALAKKSGRISINWEVVDDTFKVTWFEEGPCQADPGAPRGLGLRLVTNLIERQLQGKFSTEWHGSGVQAQFTFAFKERGAS